MDALPLSGRVKRKHTFENKVSLSHAGKLFRYPRRQAGVGVGEALSLEKDLTMFLQWPKKKRKRNPRLPAQVPRRFRQNPGSVLLGERLEPSGKSGTLLTPHSFPQELVEEILSRLPVKSLARFSCVSKLWYHLIYSESFASLHISNYKTSHQLLVGSCDILVSDCSMSFLPTPPPDGVYCDSDRVASQKVLELSQPFPPAFFGGSFNGIVCLYSSHMEDIRLWNPATKDVRAIPKSDIPRLLSRVCHMVELGFDPKTNDYKILQMVSGNHGLVRVLQLELYSLRKNSWRKVDSHDFYFTMEIWIGDTVCSLPFTEYKVICGLVMTLNRPTRCEIFVFDMSSEILDTIPIPLSLEAEFYSRGNRHVKIVPFKESIALGISSLGGIEGENSLNIFVLNDLYASDSSRSWSKLFSVEHNLGPAARILGFWESNILYQRTTTKSGKYMNLGILDLGSGETRELVSWTGGAVNASIYKESIVGVGGEKFEISKEKRLQKESWP